MNGPWVFGRFLIIFLSMEQKPFSHMVTAGYSDSFSGRNVQPPALMSFLEESAAEHCRSIGRDVFSLLEDGQGWILNGGGMRIKRYPRYGEEIRIDTWLSDWKRFSGIREYRIYGEENDVLGEAGGRWVYWDMKNRKPAPIPDLFRERWYFNPESPYRRMYGGSATPGFPEAASPDEPEHRVSLAVRRGDVDLYGHLHNTTYIHWLMEAVPESLWSRAIPMALGMRFFGEARLGDEVVFDTIRGSRGWIHEVRRATDGKLLVRGFSDWVEKRVALTA